MVETTLNTTWVYVQEHTKYQWLYGQVAQSLAIHSRNSFTPPDEDDAVVFLEVSACSSDDILPESYRDLQTINQNIMQLTVQESNTYKNLFI